MHNAQTKLHVTLKEAGHSITKRRRAVFEQLQTNSPTGIGELARTLDTQLDRATTYRIIELFEKLGIVNRLQRGFKQQVELSEIFAPHHHHASCQHCGKTIDINSTELEATLSRLSRENNFLAVSHSVELLGYCQDCQT
jgi:Fe2+ or Zn2+ uptake regulation protein